jgi:hypothetical protein
MAKDKKNGTYFEVTRERKASTWEVMLSVGAIGATLGFFTALLAGACSQSATLDTIVVVSMVATIFGFGLGLLVAWVFQTYFNDLLEPVARPKVAPTEAPVETAAAPAEGAAAPTEDKGQSVDYVFPEFQPDQR